MKRLLNLDEEGWRASAKPITFAACRLFGSQLKGTARRTATSTCWWNSNRMVSPVSWALPPWN
jgi:hypothetical protein